MRNAASLVVPVYQCTLLVVGVQFGHAVESHDNGPERRLDSMSRTRFVENTGQLQRRQVSYYADVSQGTVFVLEDGSLAYLLATGTGVEDNGARCLFREVVGNTPVSVPQGTGQLPAGINVFRGSDQSRWRTGIPTFRAVSLGEVRPGVRLELVAREHNVEKRFHIRPGADPEGITVAVEGADHLSVTAEGELEVHTSLGPVRFTAPLACQDEDGRRTAVPISYRIENQRYGFNVGDYDTTRDLLIDPLLASTFLGGANGDIAFAMTVDTNGNVYVAGSSLSTDFPVTPTAYGTNHVGGRDVVITKFNPGLTEVLASTYIGGDANDEAFGVCLDTNGALYVTGTTKSTNYPSLGGYQTTLAGGQDVFVSKLDSSLTNLIASTLVGGNGDDYANGIGVGRNDDIYIAGETSSSNFPTTPTAYDPAFNQSGSGIDCFVARLNGALSELPASTFLGDTSDDVANGIAVDPTGGVWVAGGTMSSNFPTTANSYDTSHNGGWDAFVSKLDANLSNLVASTFIGSTNQDTAYSLDLDGAGNVYTAGSSYSAGFPTTPGAYDTNGLTFANQGFVSKLDSGLTNLLASTLLGRLVVNMDLTMAPESAVYVAGSTHATDFPTTGGAHDRTHNGSADVFVSRFDPDLSTLQASTYHGGAAIDNTWAVALDRSNNVYVVGETYSSDFPTVHAHDPSYNLNADGFVSRFDPNLQHWWYSYGVVDTNATVTNDYAAANQGQLKWMAGKARAAMDDLLTDGADSTISNLVNGFTATNNYQAVNIGQAKNTAQPFYDRLGLTNYPWLGAAATNDYGAANIGQIKNLFSFPIHD